MTDRQTCLKLRARKPEADRMFELLDAEFEDDGLPVARTEIDEAEQLFDIAIYCATDEDIIADVTGRMKDRLGSDLFGATLTREDLPDIDWVTKSLEGLKPVRAGRFLVHGSHDRAAVRPGDLAIEIEAARAFGTGHHGTTAGCLEMIETVTAMRKPHRTLDLGTGSAVLAMATALLHRTHVLATDIDPVATAVARSNTRLNHLHPFIRCETATGFAHRAFAEEGPFDLIIANILARPLMKMAPELVRHLMPDGDVILSGILATQRWRVLAAYRGAGLAHVRTIQRGDWVTIHLRRPARGDRLV